MSFSERKYGMGDRVVAVVPCHSPTGSLSECEQGNMGGRRAWASARYFKLVEGNVNFLQRTASAGGQLSELGIEANNRLSYSPYWGLTQGVIEATMRNLTGNPNLSLAAKRFMMDLLIPRVVASGGYSKLLTDITKAMGREDATPQLVELDRLRAEAQQHGIFLMQEDEQTGAVLPPAGLPDEVAESLDTLSESLLELAEQVNSSPSEATNTVRRVRPPIDFSLLNPFENLAQPEPEDPNL